MSGSFRPNERGVRSLRVSFENVTLDRFFLQAIAKSF